MTDERSLFRELLEGGDVEPTGKMQLNSHGEMEPTYRLTAKGRDKAERIFRDQRERAHD